LFLALKKQFYLRTGDFMLLVKQNDA